MTIGRFVGTFLYVLAFSVATLSFSLSTSLARINGSRAAVVMEASTGKILWAKNPDHRLPPASTAKLMTAILVLEKGDLSRMVTISKNASRVQPFKAGFKRGDRVTVEELLYAALLRSANDAAVALAEAVAGSEERFVLLMNQKAAEIGATHTKFINASGLPGPRQYITAADLSRIMKVALGYPKLKEVMGAPAVELSIENGATLFLKSTNKLLSSDEALIGGKTGYTARAGHCFVCAAEREKEIIIVAILGSPSRKRLWDEARELIGKGFQMITAAARPTIPRL